MPSQKHNRYFTRVLGVIRSCEAPRHLPRIGSSEESPKFPLVYLSVAPYNSSMNARNTQTTTELASEIGKKKPFASLRQEAYLNLVRTHRQLASEFARLFKKHGLSDPQYNALRILRGEGKPMQIYQIAERMVSPQTDISRLVDRLVNTGLAARELSSEDRRVTWVTLTPKGKSILKKLDRPVRELHESHFGDLNDKELETLNRLLLRARKPTI